MKNGGTRNGDRVRRAREARGLSQVELAAATKLTRQSVGAIESDRVTPSVDVAIRIATALDRSVEDLFAPESPEPSVVAESPSPTPDGRLSLAHIAGRWVAHGLRNARDAHSRRRNRNPRCAGSPRPRRHAAYVLGCTGKRLADGVRRGLGLLADRLNTARGAGRFVWLSCSSTSALEALARNHTHLAGVHLVDAKTGAANVPDVRRIVRDAPVALITLGRWEMGLVVPSGRSVRVRSRADLGRSDIKLGVREKGAGARRLLERVLREEGVPVARTLAGRVRATGHLEVAQLVATGSADAGIATRDAALAFGLGFLPVAEERYDLALRLDSASDMRVQRLLDGMTSAGFRRELSFLGYDVRSSGDRVAEVFAA